MKKIYILLCLFIITTTIHAQNHYWSQEWGAENNLLGGAVVGGVNDNAAMYYNPGRLGFINAAKVSVSANAYGVDIVKLKNAAGTNLDLNSAKLMLYPQIASGSIGLKKSDKFKLVYGTLVRYRTNLHYEQTTTKNYDVFKSLPGDEFYDAHVEYDYNSIANWLGASFAYKINKHWAVGYSQFFSYINLQYHQSYNITSDNKIGRTYFVSANNYNLSFNINNVNAIGKLGIAYETGFKKKEDIFLRIGFTAMLPSFKIYGKSKISQSSELFNIDEKNFLADSLLTGSTVLNNANSSIKTTYKDAASLAWGFEIENKHIRVCVTVEYFFKVKEYYMFKDNSQTVRRPVKNNAPEYFGDYMTIKQSNKQVVNAGIGFEYKLDPKKKKNLDHTWSILAGIRTDFNNHDKLYTQQHLEPGSEAAFNPDNWGYIHYTVGVSIDRTTDKFSFGIDYGRGIASKTLQAINISEPTAENLLLGVKQNTVLPKINSVNLVMSYTYRFKKTDNRVNMKPL